MMAVSEAIWDKWEDPEDRGDKEAREAMLARGTKATAQKVACSFEDRGKDQQ